MRKEILALVASAVALVTLAARAQVGAVDPNRPHAEQEQEHEQEKGKKQKYTCPMHPELVVDHPGNCPKCGMKLVPKTEKKSQTPNVQHPTNSEHMMHHGDDMAMPHHDHGGHEMQMEMHSSINVADPMNREGSGTSWLPDS